MFIIPLLKKLNSRIEKLLSVDYMFDSNSLTYGPKFQITDLEIKCYLTIEGIDKTSDEEFDRFVKMALALKEIDNFKKLND